MKLPSITSAYQDARTTFLRFPFVICIASLGTAAALMLVDHEGLNDPTFLNNIFFAAVLGIPFLLTFTLVAERYGFGRNANLAVQILGVLLLTGYGMTFPSDPTHAPSVSLYRFFILGIAIHLLVAVSPFAIRGEWNGFWQYNKALFLRILTSFLYTLVLYAGLAIALAAVQNLFGVNVPGKRYLELWILLTGIFNTWFFLAGVPEDLSRLEQLAEYPKSLKVLAQYILLPIVLIYLVILYAYLAKIVATWDWPQGWVSKLILGFAGTGVFLLLLLHPIREQTDNVWIKKFTRWFYLALVPMMPMFFLAVWRRVGEYGITEGRYLALIMGAWLVFLVVYMLLSKTKSIKVVPASLCVLAFAISIGPWGVFSVAERSQIARLEKMAHEAGILVNGMVHPIQGEVPFSQAKQISASLSYLYEVHGYDGIQSWFGESLKETPASSTVAFKSPASVAQLMGFKYVEHWIAQPSATITLEAENPYSPQGYDRMVYLQTYWRETETFKSKADGIEYHLSANMDTIIFSTLGKKDTLLRVDLLQPAARLVKQYYNTSGDNVPNEAMAISAEGSGIKVKICPSRMEIQQRDGKVKLTGMHAILLYSLEGNEASSRDSVLYLKQ